MSVGWSACDPNLMKTNESGLGLRIHVIGNSCSGKSTAGQRIATKLGIPHVELDALNWEPNWVGLNESNPSEFEHRIKDATAGNEWVVSGSYSSFSKRIFWPRVQAVVWLDLPLLVLIQRMVRRSWFRWRSKELLWGTNYEKFWPQLMFWRKEDSLLWWIVTQHQRKRTEMLRYIDDPQWNHIKFLRVNSAVEIDELVNSLSNQRLCSNYIQE